MKNNNGLVIYIATIVVSIGLILFSLVPYGWKIWENILVSIGCSGIAAAVMAIFLDIHNEKKEKIKREQLRQVFLSGLNQELKHIFERVLWFDNTVDKIDMSKDIEHYLSIDFVQEAYSAGYYRQTSLEDCEKELEQVNKKYELEALKGMDDENRAKIQKMFLIIGSASMGTKTELDIIKKNEMFLLTNNIFTIDELNDIYISIGKHVELLETPNSSYGVALSFLLHGYKKIHEFGNFDQDIMCVAWQHSKNLVELLIEKRRKESTNQVSDLNQSEDRQNKRKRKNKR